MLTRSEKNWRGVSMIGTVLVTYMYWLEPSYANLAFVIVYWFVQCIWVVIAILDWHIRKMSNENKAGSR